MIRDSPCDEVVELEADHAPMLSATAQLVAALDRTARRAAVAEPAP